jgi:hypothetical protein
MAPNYILLMHEFSFVSITKAVMVQATSCEMHCNGVLFKGKDLKKRLTYCRARSEQAAKQLLSLSPMARTRMESKFDVGQVRHLIARVVLAINSRLSCV